MRRSPRNVEIAFSHGGLTHYGGILFFNEFTRVLQLRRFLTRHLLYPRCNQRYTLSQMIMALVYPVILGLDRLETASFLRSNVCNCRRTSSKSGSARELTGPTGRGRILIAR